MTKKQTTKQTTAEPVMYYAMLAPELPITVMDLEECFTAVPCFGMLALIKFPFKLLSLPLMIVCASLSLLAKLCSNLSGYVLSPLILFVFGCGVYTVIAQQWNQVLLLGIIELLFISALFGSVLIETVFDWFYAVLKGFPQS